MVQAFGLRLLCCARLHPLDCILFYGTLFVTLLLVSSLTASLLRHPADGILCVGTTVDVILPDGTTIDVILPDRAP